MDKKHSSNVCGPRFSVSDGKLSMRNGQKRRTPPAECWFWCRCYYIQMMVAIHVVVSIIVVVGSILLPGSIVFYLVL